MGWGERRPFLFSYLLAQEILNDEAPEIRKGHGVASALPGRLLPGVVLQLLCGEHPYLTAADSSRGTFNGALQRLLGPGWILAECRNAPADEREACELEEGSSSLSQTPADLLPHSDPCPWDPASSQPP